MSKKNTQSTQPAAEGPQPTSLDRFLALGALGITVLSIVCFLAIILGTWLGEMKEADFQRGFWPVISLIPLWGLPIAFLMMLTVVIRGFIRNGKEGSTPSR